LRQTNGDEQAEERKGKKRLNFSVQGGRTIKCRRKQKEEMGKKGEKGVFVDLSLKGKRKESAGHFWGALGGEEILWLVQGGGKKTARRAGKGPQKKKKKEVGTA